MKRLLILALAGTAVSPAFAQHQGHVAAPAQSNPHAGHAMPAPSAPATDPHSGHGAQPAVAQPGPHAHSPAPQSDPHAGHAVPQAADPHAGHTMTAPTVADPHAGHTMPAATDPSCPPEHAAMGHCTPSAGPTPAEIAPGAPPAEALTGPEHAADQIWGKDAMDPSREILRSEHGDMPVAKILIDRFEVRAQEGGDGYAWDVQAWHGGDIDKLWLKSEGEGRVRGGLERGDVQALWSHAIDPWFDLQAGVRQDFGSGPDRTYAVFGVQGLAPYWFEVDLAAFVSTKGEVSARAEAEYDLRLTQRLILQPQAELEIQAQDVPELRLGSGLSSGELGLRLRYQIVPELAPYVGVAYERSFGDTARLRRAAGEDRGGWSFLVGIRAWF